MSQDFRPLVSQEIAQLTNQHCTCPDWSLVKVAKGFEPSRIRNTHFSGQITLGVFEKEITFFGGLKRQAGISNATIHNCRIGNNVYINNIRNYIANYIIEDDCVIENVDLLAVEGDAPSATARRFRFSMRPAAEKPRCMTACRHRPLM